MLAVVPTPVTVRVPSKLNLHLAVGDVRDDGFHEVATVFQALSLFDEVTVTTSKDPGIDVRGEGANLVPLDGSNLAWQAAAALAERAGKGSPNIRVTIDKAIPVAGGLAGGSADAAATLVALNTLWKLEISRDELGDIAATLGSDVPFLLYGGIALGSGRGEQVLPVLSRHVFHWVLAFDDGGLSAGDVYRELDRLREQGEPPRVGSHSQVVEALAFGDPHQLASLLGNDLQAAAISLKPELRRTLRAGVEAGALAGVVCGSGPTCAFLCASQQSAVNVAAELAGAGVCRTVRVAQGPVPGARVIDGPEEPRPTSPPQMHA